MSFRHSADTASWHSRWRRANRSLLSECGIPDEVADCDRRWLYVLNHGDDAILSGWDVSWISPEQAARLLERLLADSADETYFHLIGDLRRRSAAVE